MGTVNNIYIQHKADEGTAADADYTDGLFFHPQFFNALGDKSADNGVLAS